MPSLKSLVFALILLFLLATLRARLPQAGGIVRIMPNLAAALGRSPIGMFGDVDAVGKGLVDRLIELGKPFDYMVYPHRDHGLREGSGTLVHVRMLIVRYLLENLPPGAR